MPSQASASHYCSERAWKEGEEVMLKKAWEEGRNKLKRDKDKKGSKYYIWLRSVDRQR